MIAVGSVVALLGIALVPWLGVAGLAYHYKTRAEKAEDRLAISESSLRAWVGEKIAQDLNRGLIRAPQRDRATKRRRLKLDPDLADGDHWTIVDGPNKELLEVLRIWMDHAEPGESISIELVERTDDEVANLPGI